MASGLTGTYLFPYPLQTDAVDVAADVQALAQGIETTMLLKAPLLSPTFTGVPLSTTPADADNSTKIATTAFVKNQLYLTAATASTTYAPIASPTFTGNVTMGNGDFIMGNALGDRITIYGTPDSATSYALGVESNTLYYKSSSLHRWYSGVVADGGTSEKMELASTQLLVNVPVVTPAATTTATSLRVPHGTAPSSPTNGDVWTTTAGMYARINGSTAQLAQTDSPTLTTPTISGGSFTSTYLIAPEEKWNVSATAVTTTTTVDYLTAQNWYYTTTSTAGACTINIRGNSGTTLSSLLAVGDSITFTFAIATGATTPAYFNAAQVDGTVTGVTVRWQYATTPTSGTTSGTDMYSFTVLKTAATPTYTVFASVAKW